MEQVRWQDLSTAKRAALSAIVAVEATLTAWALADLRRRPAEQVHGPKVAWALGVFVQPVGSICYLTWGRRKGR